jgi:hypothetical protein
LAPSAGQNLDFSTLPDQKKIAGQFGHCTKLVAHKWTAPYIVFNF